MENDYIISITLDQRRLSKNNNYPVRLRVFMPHEKKQKLYSTNFKLTAQEFKSAWKNKKTPDDYKDIKNEMLSVLLEAEKKAKDIKPFTFSEFEKAFFQITGDKTNVFYHYEKSISKYLENNQIGTASNYDSSRKAIYNFIHNIDLNIKDKKHKRTVIKEFNDVLNFRQITPEWLQKYENYLINQKRSLTTIGIYLRPLRAIFNNAIAENIIKIEHYPFGHKKYEIPKTNRVKKVLGKDQLKKLYEANPKTELQRISLNYWFFLFNCAGLNVKDLINLKYKNLHNDTLVYIREKTKRTTKANQKPVIVYLNEYSKNFISQYGNPNKEPDNYIFDICKPEFSEMEKFKKSINFTKQMNDNIKKIAIENGLPPEISVYWSRHSFATNAIRNGASLELISQALNHNDLSTTKAYFAGFEDKALKELTENLMNF